MYARFILSITSFVTAVVVAGHLSVREEDPTSCNGEYVDGLGFKYILKCDNYDIDEATPIVTTSTQGIAECIRLCSQYNLGNPNDPCLSAISAYAGDQFGNSPCILSSGPYNPTYNANYITAILESEPELVPAVPYAYKPTCPQDDRDFYVDSNGYTYQVLCNVEYNDYTQIQVISSTSYDACSTACTSQTSNDNECNGFQWDGTTCTYAQGLVYLDSSDTGMINIFVSASDTCEVSPLTTSVILREGNMFYQSTLNQADSQHTLNSTYTANACGCVEQCAYYNRVYNDTSVEKCLGVEYILDSSISSINCLVKSI